MTRDEARIWLAQNANSIVRNRHGRAYCMTPEGHLYNLAGCDVFLHESDGPFTADNASPAPLPELGEELELAIRVYRATDDADLFADRNFIRSLLSRAVELCRAEIEATEIERFNPPMNRYEVTEDKLRPRKV